MLIDTMDAPKCPNCNSDEVETIRTCTYSGLKAFFGLAAGLIIVFFCIEPEHPVVCFLVPILIAASMAFPLHLLERKTVRFVCRNCGKLFSQAATK